MLMKLSPYQWSCSRIPVQGGSEPSRSARCWQPRGDRFGPFDRLAWGGLLNDSAGGRRPRRDLEVRPSGVECNPEYKKKFFFLDVLFLFLKVFFLLRWIVTLNSKFFFLWSKLSEQILKFFTFLFFFESNHCAGYIKQAMRPHAARGLTVWHAWFRWIVTLNFLVFFLFFF